MGSVGVSPGAASAILSWLPDRFACGEDSCAGRLLADTIRTIIIMNAIKDVFIVLPVV
jgi:hypothetical protein